MKRHIVNAYKTYFHPELTKAWDKEVKHPLAKVQRIVTRQNFGDAQTHPLRPFAWMLVRVALVSPVGAVGVVLCASVVGLPLGLPIMAWVGAWCSKPIRKHPAFNTNSATNIDGPDEDWTY